MEVVISHIIQEDNALWVCDVPIEEGCLSKSHIYIFDRLFFRHPLCLPCSPLFPLLLSLFIHLGLRVHQFFLSLICFISLPSQLHHISGSFQSQCVGFFLPLDVLISIPASFSSGCGALYCPSVSSHFFASSLFPPHPCFPATGPHFRLLFCAFDPYLHS